MGETHSPDPGIAAVGNAALERLEQVAAQMTERIRATVPAYGPGGIVTGDELRRSCRAHARFVLGALAGTHPGEQSLGRRTGRRGAELGIPLPDLMSAYRLGLTRIWEEVAAVAVEQELTPAIVVSLTAEVWRHHEDLVSEVITEHREVLARQMLTAEEEASALVESLLEGRTGDRTTLRETAQLLRLPADGPYVAVFAEVLAPGRHALAGVRERLAALDLPSAWRLLPDGQVGIVRVDSVGTSRLTEYLERVATDRVGLSPSYQGLAETADAVRLARLAMASCVGGTRVRSFGDDLIGVVSVADPEVMGRFAGAVLGGLDSLPVDERAMLLDTLRTWLAHGGSAKAAAEALYVHPNTVRHRLRRIEERTGRTIADPRGVTELFLAAQIDVRR